MSVKKGLGRGFSSLIPTDLFDESFDPTAGQDEKVSELRNIKLTQIVTDPNQPRRHFEDEAIEELKDSIVRHGVVQPIVVTPHGDGYQIVAGERRFRAATRAKLETIPALVRTLSDQHKLELALIENLQRRDLNAIETATAYVKLRDQFNLTLEEIGQNVGGKSISAVSNTLRLLKLPKAVQQAIAAGQLTEGQARPLIGLDEKLVAELLPQIIKEAWSARKIEQVVHAYKHQEETKVPTDKVPDLNRYRDDIEQLTQRYKAPVKVKLSSGGSGQIVIGFKNDEEFKRLKKTLL